MRENIYAELMMQAEIRVLRNRVEALEAQQKAELDKVTWTGGFAYHRGHQIATVDRAPITIPERYRVTVFKCHILEGVAVRANFKTLSEAQTWAEKFGRLA